MPNYSWDVAVNGELHAVEVVWSQWSNTGHVAVDGRVVDRWGRTLNLAHKRVSVGTHEGYIRWAGAFVKPPDLFIDGGKVA